MKIGFIGTSIRMEIVRKILAEYFPEVEAEIYFLLQDGGLSGQDA